MEFIEQVKTGCSKHETGRRGGRRHYEWRADYKTVFHDCLPGKVWLETHYHDVIPELRIDILIDGDLKASINGNYKRGMIRQLVKVS